MRMEFLVGTRVDALVAVVSGPVAAQAQGGPAGDGGGGLGVAATNSSWSPGNSFAQRAGLGCVQARPGKVAAA